MRRGVLLLSVASLLSVSASGSGCGSFGAADPLEGGVADGAVASADGAADATPDAPDAPNAAVATCDGFDRSTAVGTLWTETFGVAPIIQKGVLTMSLQSSSTIASQLRTGVLPLGAGSVELSAQVTLDALFTSSFPGRIYLLELDASPSASQEIARVGVRNGSAFVMYRTYPDQLIHETLIPNLTLAMLKASPVSLGLRVRFAPIPTGHVTVTVNGTVEADVAVGTSALVAPTMLRAAIGPDPGDGATPLNSATYDNACLAVP